MSELIFEAKQTLIDTCHMLHSRRMVSGSGGNVSVRVDDRIFITPTGVSLCAINQDNLVELHMDGTWLGETRPSKEYVLHLSCYRNRPEITAVVHAHALYSVALSCQPGLHDHIPAYFPGYAMRVGELPLLPYMKPGAPELARAVSQVIAARNSVLLANHGVVCVGQDMSQALNIMEEIEENAQLHFILQGSGRALGNEDLAQLSGKA